MDIFYQVREVPGLKKKPSTSELIDWLKLLLHEDMPLEVLQSQRPRQGDPAAPRRPAQERAGRDAVRAAGVHEPETGRLVPSPLGGEGQGEGESDAAPRPREIGAGARAQTQHVAARAGALAHPARSSARGASNSRRQVECGPFYIDFAARRAAAGDRAGWRDACRDARRRMRSAPRISRTAGLAGDPLHQQRRDDERRWRSDRQS